ncbi:helix-turn-helix domain-containing protein [Cohnella cellulosilytica]|uniref:Helix-turn-helix domain-containing protein n=1 Tax=Cohnella cellulosilytica TaxID=986710 RepID=A0ABW2FDX0_9BACL
MDIGSRIKLIRKQQNRTQDEIALQCGFTKSLLSKIENGKTMPPVATLMKISEALGIRVSDLLEEQPRPGTIFNTADQTRDPNRWVKTDKGYSFYAYASERRDKAMQPYLFRARKDEVKAHSLSHRGEEFIYMLSGIMKYRIGQVEYTLHPGDGIYFNSLEDHMLIPQTDTVEYLALFADDRD